MPKRASWVRYPEHIIALCDIVDESPEITPDEVLRSSVLLSNHYDRAQISSKLQTVKKDLAGERSKAEVAQSKSNTKKDKEERYQVAKKRERSKLMKRLAKAQIGAEKKLKSGKKRRSKSFNLSDSSDDSSSAYSSSVATDSESSGVDSSLEVLAEKPKKKKKALFETFQGTPTASPAPSFNRHRLHAPGTIVQSQPNMGAQFHWVRSSGLKSLVALDVPLSSTVRLFLVRELEGRALKLVITRDMFERQLEVEALIKSPSEPQWQTGPYHPNPNEIFVYLPEDLVGKQPTLEKKVERGIYIFKFQSLNDVSSSQKPRRRH